MKEIAVRLRSPEALSIRLTDEKIEQFELQRTMTDTDSEVKEGLSKEKKANRQTKTPHPPPLFICSNESDEFDQGAGPLADLHLD